MAVRIDLTFSTLTVEKMGSQHISFQLPSEVIEAIEAEAKRTGQSETAVVLTILTQAFVGPYPASPDITLEQLQRQLNELRVQILSLSEQLQERLLMGLDSEVSTAIRSLPTDQRLAWMSRVLTEAGQRELIQQAIIPNGSVYFSNGYFPLPGQIHSDEHHDFPKLE